MIPEKGTATVVKHTGSHYLLTRLPEWDLFPAVLRGKIRLKGSTTTNPMAVGDIVDYTFDGTMGTIDKIHPRRNYIIRRSTNLSRESHIIAANLDRVYLIVTLAFPETKLAFVDRFLVTCEAYGVPVTILINKCDLHDEALDEMADTFEEIYGGAGYDILRISAKTGENIDRLKELCREGINLFSGTSGVGKSSLIKAIDPSLDLIKTGEISAAHLQGRHTTTFYQMHPIAGGGYIIDTPGIRGFGLVDLEKEELSTYFPEMLKVMDNCRFKPCTHTHEPGCAVKEAVENGEISSDRYYSYLGMLEEETKYR
ncbi:MAG: ribosome small subunit-dependent GTPase A [Bacteroidales bacterium]|nr:ribosome small subunit-dependent GTPase A [Candidatus Equibacterium intestinale]